MTLSTGSQTYTKVRRMDWLHTATTLPTASRGSRIRTVRADIYTYDKLDLASYEDRQGRVVDLRT